MNILRNDEMAQARNVTTAHTNADPQRSASEASIPRHPTTSTRHPKHAAAALNGFMGIFPVCGVIRID
jgi:hypothetical protein